MNNQTFMLTPKQKQVFELLGRGLVAKEIAHKLGMSHRTVDKHTRTVRENFGAVNTTQAVAICISKNLISVE